MRHVLRAAATAVAVAAAAASSPLAGALAYVRCGSVDPSGECAPHSVEVAALDLATGNSSVVARFPNATGDALLLQNLAAAPAADALFVSLPDASGGQLVRLSLRTGAVVSSIPAPACAFLAVDDVPSPTSALCLTDAPFYGQDGRAYLLRLHLDGGAAPTRVATWDGSPVPDDVVAVYDPHAGVLFADLLDEASQQEYLLGWNVSTGALVSQVVVPPSTAFLAAVWAPDGAAGGEGGRVLGVVNNYTSQARVLAAVDLRTGAVAWPPVSTVLTPFLTVYGVASFDAAATGGAVLVTAEGSGGAGGLRLVGVNATSGRVELNMPAKELLGSFAFVPRV